MKKNNKLLIIIIIILLLILGFVLYAYYSDYKKAQESTGERIISAHLEGFPVGSKIYEGMEGEEKTVFKKGEWMGIVGKVRTNENREISFKIVDEDNNIVAEDVDWEKNIQTGEGDFGMCCFVVPEESGQYKVQLYLDDELQQSLNFSVAK